MKKIMLIGGGSGGHTTPIIFVAREIKNINPEIDLYYVGHRKDKDSKLFEGNTELFKKFYSLKSGKLRRYSGQTLIQTLLDYKTIFFNIRDILYLLGSVLKSIYLLLTIRPDKIFFRGSYLGVPIAKIAGLFGMEYYIHESDSVPSLSNRLVASKAKKIFVSYPKDVYRYDKSKMVLTGVPMSPQLKEIKQNNIAELKSELGIKEGSTTVLVTGGGHGARRLNNGAAQALAKRKDNLFIIQITGQGKDDDVRTIYEHSGQKNVIILPQIPNIDILKWMRVSDFVISRAGMTALSELAYLQKAVILVPNHQLSDSHQTKNADYLAKNNACLESTDEEAELNKAINSMIDNRNNLRKVLGDNLHQFLSGNSDATTLIAKELLK